MNCSSRPEQAGQTQCLGDFHRVTDGNLSLFELLKADDVITIETLFAETWEDPLPLEMSKCHLLELEDAAHERYDPHRPCEGDPAGNAVTTPESAATEAGTEQSSNIAEDFAKSKSNDVAAPVLNPCISVLAQALDLTIPVLAEKDVVESLLVCQFFKNEYIEVKRSAISGYGVFARRQLRQGDVILREKALFKAEFGKVEKAYEMCDEQTRRVIRGLYANAVLRREQKFLKAIWSTNCFSVQGNEAGLFAIASRFNHRCHPSQSVAYTFDGKADCLVFSVKDETIKAGQELTISYGQGYSPRRLYAHFGFRCACGTCRGLTAKEVRSMCEW